MFRLKKIVFTLALMILPLLIQRYWILNDNEIKKIDIYEKFNPTFLTKPKVIGDNIQITVNEKKISKMGLFEISLINYTDVVFKKIPIIIKVTPTDKDKFHIITHYAVGEKNLSDLTKEIKPLEFDGENYIFSYEVETLNRTEKNQIGFTLNILCESDQKPKVEVFISGADTREFSWDHSPYQQDLTWKVVMLSIFALLFAIFILVFVFFPLLSFSTKRWEKKNDQKYAKSLYTTILDNNLISSLTDREKKLFIQELLFKRKYKMWEQQSPIKRWIDGMSEPKIEDYKID